MRTCKLIAVVGHRRSRVPSTRGHIWRFFRRPMGYGSLPPGGTSLPRWQGTFQNNVDPLLHILFVTTKATPIKIFLFECISFILCRKSSPLLFACTARTHLSVPYTWETSERQMYFHSLRTSAKVSSYGSKIVPPSSLEHTSTYLHNLYALRTFLLVQHL